MSKQTTFSMKRTLRILLTASFLYGLILPLSSQVLVSGKVLDPGGLEPLIGASVYEKGKASNGVITDIDGNYSIYVTDESSVLVYTYVGYATLEEEVGDRTTINVYLNPQTELLDEVIVTSLGIRREEKTIGFAAEQISGEALVNARETNLVSALSGKVAGVDIISTSGSPGASANIVIRGRTSFNGSNAPLFVIDGIPIDNSYAGSNFTDQSNRAIDLNPNDIEDITVLKGAAATALYGMRAGNGAIIITTKSSPGDGQTRVELSTELSFDQVNKLPQQQSLYAQGTGGNYVDPQSGSPRSWGPLIDTLRYADDPGYTYSTAGRIVGMSDPTATSTPVTPFDNANNFFQTGVRSNTNLTLSGGTDKSNYLVALGHLRQTGVVPVADFTRSTARLQGSLAPWEKVRVTGTMTYSLSGGNRQQRGSNLSGVMLGLMRAPRTFDLTNGSDDPVNDPLAYELADGTQRGYNPTYDNPYWSVNRNRVNDRVNRVIGNIGISYDVFENAQIQYRIGIDQYSEERKSYWDANSGEFAAISGLVINDVYEFFALNSDLILNYSKRITDDFSLDALLGHNYYDERAYNIVQEGESFIIPGFYDVSNTQLQIFYDGLFRERTVGAYYEFTLGYQDYLYLTTTGRNDWSSTLPAASNSFFYPSTSLSFIFSEPLGLATNPILSYGKLRLSYGLGGNAAPDPYLLAIVFNSVAQVQGRTSFLRDPVIGSQDLQPERTSSFEIGTDLRFFQNRLTADITWYNNVSDGQIVALPVPFSTGFVAKTSNGGKIRNSGVELLLGGTILQREDLIWEANLNYSRNRNIVLELDESTSVLPLPGSGVTSTRNVIVEGEPYGVIFGTRWLRDDAGNLLIDDSGYPLVDSVNGIVGDPNPDWLMGIRNTLSYQQFQLSFLFDFRRGGDIFNGTRGVMLNLGIHEETENREEEVVIDGVRASDGAPNETAIQLNEDYYSRYPFAGVSEAAIEDGSFTRLRELTLSYEFPAAWVDRYFSAVSLSFSARNLLLFTKYTGIDPETNLSGASNSFGRDWFNAPNTRSYGVYLRIQF
jgi:TonB-linked SusC/RagA family outer membrane protein